MTGSAHYKSLLLDMFHVGLYSVSAAHILPEHLRAAPPKGKTLVLGAGKAAAAMAAVTAQHIAGDYDGLVVVPYGHKGLADTGFVEIAEAAHPVPDGHSAKIARRMLALAARCGPGDRLIFLSSGGGSAVLSLPAPPLKVSQKRDIVRHLVHSGASISQINCLRKHISAIKGGRLAAACHGAEIQSFVISDVPGDDPADVASGPTIADKTTCAQARDIATHFAVPHKDVLDGILGDPRNETPKPGVLRATHTVIARAADFLRAASDHARAAGWTVRLLGDDLQGEARELGAAHGRLAFESRASGQPCLFISGGETTVTMGKAGGAGGPNQEYLAGMAKVLNGAAGIYALACDSDGIDGKSDAAGAFLGPTSIKRAAAKGVYLDDALAAHHTGDFFAATGDLITTGPTLTNVNDFRAILVTPG